MFLRKKIVEETMKEIEKEMQELNRYWACFTGHRPQKLPWGYNENDERCIDMINRTKAEIENAIKKGYHTFLCGMALGFDMICAEIVLELKKKYPYVILEGAIPCLNQDAKWNSQSKERYRKILGQCDVKTVLSEVYTPTCMNDRNMYMVEQSDVVIAIWNGKPSGTGNTVQFAKEKGCKIKIINPEKYR